MAQNADPGANNNHLESTFLVDVKKKFIILEYREGYLESTAASHPPIASVLFRASQMVTGPLLESLEGVSSLCLFHQYHVCIIVQSVLAPPPWRNGHSVF